MTTENLQDVVSTAYDLVFVGFGASTSYSLIGLCEQYTSVKHNPLRVLVVESASEFYTGVAYGSRSGENSLILTRLDQFYPCEELAKFAAWIRETGRESDIWEFESEKHVADLTRLPLSEFEVLLGTICVKRKIIGEFIAWRVQSALSALSVHSGLTVRFVSARAKMVACNRGKFPLLINIESSLDEEAHLHTIRTKKMILAVGTRPRKALVVNGQERNNLSPRIISDPYEGGGIDFNHQNMINAIQSRTSGVIKILVLGSNASAMESIYLLSKRRVENHLPLEVIVVSTIGDFPAKIPDVIDDTKVEVPEIESYLAQGVVTSDGLYSAALKGLKRLIIQGESLESYNRSIDSAVLKALKTMTKETRLEFLREKCNALGRHKRRAEKHYHDTMSAMVDSGKLKIIPGLLKSVSVSSDKIVAKIETTDCNVNDIHVDGLINCGASERLNEYSNNPLLASMIESGLVEVDKSGNCFKTINGGFRISDNIYVAGPLLAGNIVNDEPVWHLEHCGRIIRFSSALSEELLKTVERTPELVES